MQSRRIGCLFQRLLERIEGPRVSFLEAQRCDGWVLFAEWYRSSLRPGCNLGGWGGPTNHQSMLISSLTCRVRNTL